MKKSIPWMVCFILITGCSTTPTGNIEAFADAAKSITDKVESVIKEYNEESIRNELTKLAQHKKPIRTSSLDPVQNAIIHHSDRKKYALYRATHALGTYAEALSALASSGSSNDIGLAATKLYSSLSGFNQQYRTLTGNSKDLVKNETSAGIGKIVAAIGGAYADKKRGDAIKVIVIKADPYIQSMSDIIIRELLKGVIEHRLYTMKNTELSGYIKDYNSKVATAGFAKKRALLDNIYAKYLEMQSSSASVAQAVKAIKLVKQTHATLKNEIEKDHFSSSELVRAIGRLKDLNNHYNDLESIMLTCDTEIIVDDSKGIICKGKS